MLSSAYHACRASLTLADFDIIRRIGDGSFSEVMHVRDKRTGINYALKMVDKHLIVRHKMVDHIKQVLPRPCTQKYATRL